MGCGRDETGRCEYYEAINENCLKICEIMLRGGGPLVMMTIMTTMTMTMTTTTTMMDMLRPCSSAGWMTTMMMMMDDDDGYATRSSAGWIENSISRYHLYVPHKNVNKRTCLGLNVLVADWLRSVTSRNSNQSDRAVILLRNLIG